MLLDLDLTKLGLILLRFETKRKTKALNVFNKWFATLRVPLASDLLEWILLGLGLGLSCRKFNFFLLNAKSRTSQLMIEKNNEERGEKTLRKHERRQFSSFSWRWMLMKWRQRALSWIKWNHHNEWKCTLINKSHVAIITRSPPVVAVVVIVFRFHLAGERLSIFNESQWLQMILPFIHLEFDKFDRHFSSLFKFKAL